MNNLRIPILIIIGISLLTNGCKPSQLPELPTPEAPPISEVDDAILRWEASNTANYAAEIDETTPKGTRKIRLVVVNGQVRAAQFLNMEAGGEYDSPTSMPLSEAQNYTIEAILERVRKDALAAGPAPVNLEVIFDQNQGYPSVVQAEALPSYNEEGHLMLNREYSYSLAIAVDALLEDIFGIGKDPLMILTRSGGPEAWCDNLRVFPDGSSIYTNDCTQALLQQRPPSEKVENLKELGADFASLDVLREGTDQVERLIIIGSGEGSPDAGTIEQAWEQATELGELLSQPVGEGLTMLFTDGGKIIGLDMLSLTSQPGTLPISGQLYGAVVSPDGKKLVYADESGVRSFDLSTGDGEIILQSPGEEERYIPRALNSQGTLILSRVTGSGEYGSNLGWIKLEDNTWNDLPLPTDMESFGCDTGLSFNTQSEILAITGLGYGHACNQNPGLTLVDLENGTSEALVAPLINSGLEDEGQITAGAHAPAWSADGEWIAFGLDDDASESLDFPTRVYIVRPDGSDLTPVTENTTGMANHPTWGPDGSLYYGLTGAGEDVDGIYHYDFSTKEHTLVVTGSGLEPLSAAPTGEFLAYREDDGDLKAFVFSYSEILPVATREGDSLVDFVGWLSAKEE